MNISVQFISVAQSCPTQTPWITACQASLSITHSRSLLKFMSIKSVVPSSQLILCLPLLLLPPVPPSIRVFPNESTLHMRWPKYWSFSFSISPSNEHPGLISFRMDWLDVLEGTSSWGSLMSLLQHHSSTALILWRSAFFIVQLSHPYMTTAKTIALTRRTFVDKVMSLFFNMLSRLVITFLLRSKRLLISWLQSLSAVILEPPKIKSDTVSTISPSISHEVLDSKESWVLKNWCFWTVVWEKTLESPLDCKEIQPVHPKGDQSWLFIGRTDVEAETPILWTPDAKSWLIGKDPDAGKDWGQEEKGTTEDDMVGWHHWLNAHGFGWIQGVVDGQGGLACCSSWGHKELDMTDYLNLYRRRQETERKWKLLCNLISEMISPIVTNVCPLIKGH